MTPVEATRTSCGSQPTASAVAVTISRAADRPASPVQAFAHLLLTTIARARPPDCASCARDTRTGAATARLVVKIPAALAGSSQASRARSSPAGLSPQATPAARKPRGAVMPPATGSTARRISVMTSSAPAAP